MRKSPLPRWRANFFAGLAIVLPAVISIAVVAWLFGTVSNITDTLLIFLPKAWTHKDAGNGPMQWYWSLVALTVAILLIGLMGGLARNYVGKKLIQLLDSTLLRIPLLNKIYGTVKQVNQAISPSSKSSFKQVVLVEFPRTGMYSVGFVTGEEHGEVCQKTHQNILSVFIPTTPNPTSGFLVLVPDTDITKLDMSVAEGIKFIISLGSIAPEMTPTKP
jgi:uncharacterized membrane protein